MNFTLKRQRYVMLCVCSLNYLYLSKYCLESSGNSKVKNYIENVFDEIFNKEIDKEKVLEKF